MKKFAALAALAPLAATAALALAPGSALAAVGPWAGWSTSHSDQVDAGYAAGLLPGGNFGMDGAGDSQYCVDPTNLTSMTPTGCSGTAIPVVVTGVFVPTRTGCGAHEVGTASSQDPCANGDVVGGIFVGTTPGNGVGLQG